MFLVLIGLEGLDELLEQLKAEFAEDVHTGKSFNKEGFVLREASSRNHG
ncbi:MAG: hypothetical protein ACE5R6_08770 [Candidatus Heimdallarchaeota archaeon]